MADYLSNDETRHRIEIPQVLPPTEIFSVVPDSLLSHTAARYVAIMPPIGPVLADATMDELQLPKPQKVYPDIAAPYATPGSVHSKEATILSLPNHRLTDEVDASLIVAMALIAGALKSAGYFSAVRTRP